MQLNADLHDVSCACARITARVTLGHTCFLTQLFLLLFLVSKSTFTLPLPVEMKFDTHTHTHTHTHSGGEGAIKALQKVSIISGVPLTIAICFMCASLHCAAKYDMGEKDMIESTRFITGLFDWTEGCVHVRILMYIDKFRVHAFYLLHLPTLSVKI